jgi:hypothetical protein
MIELLAYAKEDGWAFYRDEATRVWHIRPPFSLPPEPRSESSVSSAVCQRGYSVPAAKDFRFETVEALRKFLGSEMISARWRHPATDDAATELMNYATVHQVVRWLDRVEQELFPKHEWVHAERFLRHVLRLPAVVADPAVSQRAADMLTRVLARTT